MSKARELAELGAVYDSGALSNRNIIINGAFLVAQRGTSSTTNGYQTVDRWGASLGDGTSTKAQSTDAPSGFANSFSITMSTAAGSIAGYNYAHHYIEGNLIDQFAFETSDAKNITLSFYVKSSITGTWGGAIRNYVVSPATSYRSQSFTYTINAANTWERKTVTIAGDTGGSGQWNTGSLGSMSLFFDMGSVALTQATGSWLGNNCVGATGTQTSFITTTNATWQITGVQLEVGSEATPFEHRSYGDELARCQRYFEKEIPTWGTPRSTDNVIHSTGYFKVQKRASPTMTLVNDVYSNSPAIQQVNLNYYVTYDAASANSSLNATYDADAEL